jgi:outer membrane protein
MRSLLLGGGLTLLLSAFGLLADIWEARAQTAQDENKPRIRQTSPPDPTLRLEDFLRRVDRFYPKLLGADADRRTAAEKRRAKRGAFDTVVSYSTDTLTYNSEGKPKTGLTNQVAVEVPTRYGAKFFAIANLNTGDVKAPDSLTGAGGQYIIGVKLPLLRGAGINPKAADEQRAIVGVGLADQEFAGTRLEILLKAANVYWKWVANGRKLQAAQDLLKVAEIRYKAIKDEFEAGARPGIDVQEAEQEVARRAGNLRKAERDFQEQTFALSLYLWDDDGERTPAPPFAALPELFPAPAGLSEADILNGRQKALENRPELKEVRLNRRLFDVDLRLARNDRQPNVDLVFNPGIDTGANNIGNTMKAGILFSVPLERNDATGRINEARLKLTKNEQDEKLTRATIVTEVDDAANAVNKARERYIEAQREYEKALIVEQGERDKLAAGDSTLFLVNQRERATFEAFTRVIDVQAEYEQFIALFRAVTAQF